MTNVHDTTVPQTDRSTDAQPPADLTPIDLYKDVHKGLRRALFTTTELAGRTDGGDHAAVDDLLRTVANLQQLLRWHHHHEDALLQPTLDDQIPDLAGRVRDEHAEIELHMSAVDRLVAELVGAASSERPVTVHAVYLELASFTGRYLAHQDLEERRVMLALSGALTHDGLASLDLAIRTAVPLDEMLLFLRQMVPAMPPAERAAMLVGMQEAMPAHVFAPVLAAAHDSLDPIGRLDLADQLGAGLA
jgi:hypothetical protein